MKRILCLVSLAVALTAGCVFGPPPPYPGYVVRPPAPAPSPPLTDEDIVRMSHAGISESVMIEKINSNGLTVRPNPEQLVNLKKEGLSDNVLQAMVTARVGPPPSAAGTTYAYDYPGYYYPYYSPYYYPYPYSYYPYSYGPWGYGYGWGYWGGHYGYYGSYPHYGYYHGYHGTVIHH
jgi:hypothetical protein